MFDSMKTAIPTAGLAALGGQQGMVPALGFALATNVLACGFPDRMVLGMYGAREVDATSAPELHGTVRELAQRAGLPMPRVYRVDEDAPNAFATGRDPRHAAVAATTGIPRALASALGKIDRHARGLPLQAAERHPETAQTMIVDPLSGGGLRGLFSTHPSTVERVERWLPRTAPGRAARRLTRGAA